MHHSHTKSLDTSNITYAMCNMLSKPLPNLVALQNLTKAFRYDPPGKSAYQVMISGVQEAWKSVRGQPAAPVQREGSNGPAHQPSASWLIPRMDTVSDTMIRSPASAIFQILPTMQAKQQQRQHAQALRQLAQQRAAAQAQFHFHAPGPGAQQHQMEGPEEVLTPEQVLALPRSTFPIPERASEGQETLSGSNRTTTNGQQSGSDAGINSGNWVGDLPASCFKTYADSNPDTRAKLEAPKTTWSTTITKPGWLERIKEVENSLAEVVAAAVVDIAAGRASNAPAPSSSTGNTISNTAYSDHTIGSTIPCVKMHVLDRQQVYLSHQTSQELSSGDAIMSPPNVLSSGQNTTPDSLSSYSLDNSNEFAEGSVLVNVSTWVGRDSICTLPAGLDFTTVFTTLCLDCFVTIWPCCKTAYGVVYADSDRDD